MAVWVSVTFKGRPWVSMRLSGSPYGHGGPLALVGPLDRVPCLGEEVFVDGQWWRVARVRQYPLDGSRQHAAEIDVEPPEAGPQCADPGAREAGP